jgi:hypothetical protein
MAKSLESNPEFLAKRKELASSLVERHTGTYTSVNTEENHILPYEDALLKKDKLWFEKLDPCDFLYKSADLNKGTLKLDKGTLKSACTAFYQNSDRGGDYYQSALRPFNKHIRKITNQTLTTWLEGDFAQDAIKTTYLLYKLHLCTPSGLNMLANATDARYVSVELFSARHKPVNKAANPEEDNVILLSAWLKELIINVIHHRDYKYKVVLKNLDSIHSGYLTLYNYIYSKHSSKHQAELFDDLFPAVIRDRELPVKEELSTTLIRAWQMKRAAINQNASLTPSITDPLILAINSHLKTTELLKVITPKMKQEIIDGASFLTYYVYAIKFRKLTKVLTESEFDDFLHEIKAMEPKIVELLTSDIENDIRVVAKGIGSDSKQTSLLNTLRNYFEQNRDIIKSAWEKKSCATPTIHLNNGCDTHLTYLWLRIHHIIEAPNSKGEEYVNNLVTNQEKALNQYKEFCKLVNCYIQNMSVTEIYDDMKRVDKYMSNLTKGSFRLLPRATEFSQNKK